MRYQTFSDSSGRHERRLCICVDDFGSDDAMNQAVFSLAEQGRISTVSCQVNGDAWRSGAARLRNREFKMLETGLHLDLTEHGDDQYPVHQGSFASFVGLACLRALDKKWLRRMIERQLDLFEDTMGKQPDHVDGHLHVHQLPLIREELTRILARRYSFKLPWLRISAMHRRPTSDFMKNPSGIFKELVINALGSSALATLADENGFSRSERLLGVYGFESSKASYSNLLESWISECRTGDVLMCHPIIDLSANTRRTKARHSEFLALGGDALGNLLREQSVSIAPLKP